VTAQPISLLRGATLIDGAVVDVRIAGGIITSVTPADPAAQDGIDLQGHLLMTAPAEPHAHLDKALSWDALQPPLGDLNDAIAAWKAGSVRFDEANFRGRAREAALAALRNGTTAVRTHVDVLAGDDPLRGIRAVDAVRRELAEVMDIEIVALIKAYSDTGLLYAALDAGADLVGGSPHNAPDPAAELHRLLGVAEDRGVGADLHTDEFLFGDHITIADYAQRAGRWPQGRTRTASHCTRLGTMSADELAVLLPQLAAAGLGVVTNPITNLYLQGRDTPVATPRGITAIAALQHAGVPVAAGADNVRDPFNPLGRSDALETAMLAVTAGHVHPEVALDMVTERARVVMGLPQAGPHVGARADLLAVRGTSAAEVIATAPADRVVIHRGRMVARSQTSHWQAWSEHVNAGVPLAHRH